MRRLILFSGLTMLFVLTGCKTEITKNDCSITNNQNSILNDTNIKLVDIVDLTVEEHLFTADALEEFYRDTNYIYYFPSIKSEYIECRFSNGDTMKIVEALESGKIVISDLDTYNIQYWIVVKHGNYINSLDK